MPTTTTQELIDRAVAAADMFDNFVSPTEWMYWATQERYALEVFLARSGWAPETTTETFTVTGAENGDFPLSTRRVMAIVSVHESTSAGLKLLKYNNQIDFLRQLPGSTLTTGHASEYRMRVSSGESLVFNFFPEPRAGEQYLVTYVAAKPPLALLQDSTHDAVVTYPMGWEERIVLGMARRALVKEESDTSGIDRQIRELESTIEETCWSRVMGSAPAIRNTDTVNYGWTGKLLIPPWTQWAWV